MSKRTPRLLIEDIITSCQRILDYTSGLTYHDFILDQKTVDAATRNFEIIGEAANLLPENVKDLADNIDWQRIRGFRNRIVHHYFGVDLEILWKIIQENIPDLLDKTELLLKNKDV